MEQNTDVRFHYTYSAKEQEEIKRIRQRYQVQEEDRMSKLRKMDAMVSQKATVVALIFGIVGALVMGSGMSLIMTEIGSLLGLTGSAGMIVGVMIGLLGMVLVMMAYPAYIKVLKKEREKVAPEILRLTDELMR